MGSIVSSRKEDGKIVAEVMMNYEEFLQLQGHYEDIYLFTANVAHVKTNISQRGKNEATKYFLIPREFRNGFKFNNSTSCQRIDYRDKTIFVYVVDKLRVNPSRRELALKKIQEQYSSKDKPATEKT